MVTTKTVLLVATLTKASLNFGGFQIQAPA